MYLHIGGNLVVLLRKIVGIFDYSIIENKTNLDFLEVCNQSKKVVYVDQSLTTKSYIVTEDVIYYSPIATNTLKKRVSKGIQFYLENS